LRLKRAALPHALPARGRSERAFRTHQDRLIKELALLARYAADGQQLAEGLAAAA